MPEWCRTCGEPARRITPGLLGKVVHAATGEETGGDGHLIAPIRTDPVRAAAAAKVEAEFGGRWECSVVFSTQYMAVPRDVPGTPIPVYAGTPEELTAGIRRAEERWRRRR